MLARTATVIALICALSVPLRSEPLSPDGCGVSLEQRPPAEPGVCRPELPPQGTESVLAPPPDMDDIRADPDIHARALHFIAIYASVGNREGVEILTAMLRALGVSADRISEAVTWATLHRSSSRDSSVGAFAHRKAPPVESGWEASQ
jgi:hypothetical protein